MVTNPVDLELVSSTVLCLHSYKYDTEQLTLPLCISVWYDTTTSWQHVCWWLLNTNKSKGQTWSDNCCSSAGGKVGEHQHTFLSQQFWGSFPVCYIFRRKTTEPFMKPRIVTARSVLHSNYRRQHTHARKKILKSTNPHVGGVSVHIKLNICGILDKLMRKFKKSVPGCILKGYTL